MLNLSAHQRWCLSGTPIQNSLEDLGALSSFLKVPELEHAAAFRKFVISPMTSNHGRYKNLRKLLQTICIRRTRELLSLPEPFSRTRVLSLRQEERTAYNDLRNRLKDEIHMAVSGHRKSKVNSIMLSYLLKLRLFCNNGSASSGFHKENSVALEYDEILSYLQQQNQNICAYCSGVVYSLSEAGDSNGGLLLPSCHHLVCPSCLPQHRHSRDYCSACARGDTKALPAIQSISQSGNEAQQQARQYPSKLLALLSDIKADLLNKRYILQVILTTANNRRVALSSLAGRRLSILLLSCFKRMGFAFA
jgi:SWI/SNF-related matrix-associated actin-dependent regulator of chromatin subfamily A3